MSLKWTQINKYKEEELFLYSSAAISAELYDANPIDLKRLNNNLDEDEEVYFIVCGSGKISACSLWILHELKRQKNKCALYQTRCRSYR